MNTELLLFLLRVISALLLMGLLFALFFVIWRDYRSALSQAAESRRSYGHLVAIRELDGEYALTGDIYPLLPLTTLGRAPTNTVKIDDNFASSEHAVIARRNGQWWLEDRRSRNGTLLNDIPITRPVVITNGDLIGVGHLRYRVELEA